MRPTKSFAEAMLSTAVQMPYAIDFGGLFESPINLSSFYQLPVCPAYRVTKKVDSLKQAIVDAIDDVVDELVEKIPKVGAILKIADNYLFRKINNSFVSYGLTFDMNSQWYVIRCATWIIEAPGLFDSVEVRNARTFLRDVDFGKILNPANLDKPVKRNVDFDHTVMMDILFALYKTEKIYGRSTI